MSKDIFISHSSKDKPIIDKFIDLILHNGLEVKVKNIFCTSTNGTKIRPGKDWRIDIKENLINSKIILLIITSNYKESEMCLFEMGVSWAVNDLVIPFILDPITFKNAGIIIEPKQIESLSDQIGLDRLKDLLQDNKIIDNPKSDRWSEKKEEFIIFLEEFISKNPFLPLLTRIEFEKVIEDTKNSKKLYKDSIEKIRKLEYEIEELRKLKNRKDILKIDKKIGKVNEADEFNMLIKEIKTRLWKFDPIIRGIIFSDFASTDALVNGDFYEKEISNALARKIINVDDNFYVNWNSNSDLKTLEKELNNIKDFMDSVENQSFFDWFEDKYSCNFDINNLDFWEEVFEVPINID